MNNEIGRKLTSLTLMTIMLAGGMVIAAPSMVPEAAAAGLLFVSAENADFNNTFGGAQVVEVIVRDPARDETDEKQGEPTVKVDEHLLRMTQGADGYWYAYFGDKTTIMAADKADNNLDYGQMVSVLNADITNSTGPIFTTAGSMGGLTYGTAIAAATVFNSCTNDTSDCGGVIKNFPALSNYNGTWQGDGSGGSTKGSANGDGSYHVNGQIGITSGIGGEWPFIQTFDFTIETFDVRLEQAGADEVVTVSHDNGDLDDYASITLDRSSASQGSDLHLTIADNQLNIDPTAEDVVTFLITSGSEGVSFSNGTNYGSSTGYNAYDNYFDDNGVLKINYNANSADNAVLVNDDTLDDTSSDNYLVFWETAENSGIFVNTDDDDDSNLDVNSSGDRGTTALIDYNDSEQSFVIVNDFGVIDMEEASVGDEWNSGEALTVTLIDQDLNKNTASDEDLLVKTSTTAKPVPSLKIGSPLMVKASTGINSSTVTIDSFSNIARLTNATENIGATTNFTIHTGYTAAELKLMNTSNTFFNWDFSSFTNSTTVVNGVTLRSDNGLSLATSSNTLNEGTNHQGMVPVYGVGISGAGTAYTGELIVTVDLSQDMDGRYAPGASLAHAGPFVADVFSFGDGTNNAIYRLELEETGDNTATFTGTVEYRMLNQLNVDQQSTFIDLETVGDEIDIIVHEDLTDEDSPRVNYLDLGADGVSTQIADQLEAPSHSGVVSFDLDNYKIADTVVVTLDDQDMNTDSDLIDVYVTQTDDKVGDGSGDHVLDITFDDLLWVDTADSTDSSDNCSALGSGDGSDGLKATGFTLVETGLDSGIFVGSFQVPAKYCDTTNGTLAVTGKDMEVNYNDFRDASGQTIEVGDGASINANTGSVSFDRTVYPVPWGTSTTTGFAEHATATGTDVLAIGNVTVHIQVTDADYDISASGEDNISDTSVAVKIERGSESETIATVGNAGYPMIETAPDSGVFEYDLQITYNEGPATGCPSSLSNCILQGDIITVTYSDTDDASGQDQTVTDSATFDLRNGVLQSDKSVYLIGSDMILTLIEPDFDRDNDETESYTLDLIEWDSDAATSTMGSNGISGANAAFDPEPSKLRETGDSTGIFQVVIEIPDTLDSELLDRGEMIELEYTDWGPAGADYVGQEDEDIGLVIYTSNFGATVELDQKVYTWTDKVYITIVAPDHNFDSGLVDEIGNTTTDPVKVSTRGNELDNYKLVESGADTGIFIGEVTLAGFIHDADGDGTNDITTTAAAGTSTQSITTQTGPTEGKLGTSDNDGLTVSFEFSEDETVVGSALIRWNIGEVQWLEASYPASGTGVIRVIDADMNLDPEAIDNFDVDAWSDSDAGGIDLTVTETNEATGIFEGTVFFTVSNDSSGHRLRVAEGDTVTAEYEDNTLPEPYTTADELDITATSLIGTIVPPLERAPAANLRTVDAFGNSLNSVSVDQQVQLTADLANGQDREQSFAYLVQVQDGNGVTVSLAWITGSLSAGQSFSPALSWIPTESGSYTATAFVWESVDNPTALSPPVSTTISVQ